MKKCDHIVSDNEPLKSLNFLSEYRAMARRTIAFWEILAKNRTKSKSDTRSFFKLILNECTLQRIEWLQYFLVNESEY